MRGVTRLCWALALIVALSLAAGCGGTGQTAASDERLDEQTTPPAQETGGVDLWEPPSLDTPDVSTGEPPAGFMP